MSETPTHAQPLEEVLRHLEVGPERGLSDRAVQRRRREHGPNRLREPERRSAPRILLDQFRSTVVGVLLVADGLALATRQWTEAAAIFAVLLVNAAIGFVSEWRARRSMQALREIGRQKIRVRREADERTIPVDELVPGDMVLLAAGDLVPADARLVSSEGVRVSEAALTGEAVPVGKTSATVGADRPLAERTNMLFKGTTVVDGTAEAVVCGIGSATELGRIAELAESAEAAVTPLEKRLDRLGRRLAVVALVLAGLIAAAGLLSGRPAVLMVETAIALGVAAIPEGLPIVATLALARGMWSMARRQALINRLAAVETLGAARVIFSDKTGTLTENRMALRRIVTPSGDREMKPDGSEHLEGLAPRALEIGVLCNGASLASEEVHGDPTELALLRAGADRGLDREQVLEARPQIRQVPFDPEVMLMGTYHRRDGEVEVAVKGAPQAVLEACDRIATEEGAGEPLDEAKRTQWLDRSRGLAAEGLRVLAVADKTADEKDAEPYQALRFVGLVCLVDPPREGVRDAVEACRSAGIRVRVVTGDQAETATAIAGEIGLGDADELTVLTGSDLSAAGDELTDDLLARALETDVFARLSPAQKLGLVRAYQEAGEVVAMTGDGVNDAPALKKADIGIAMGRRGTDAARQAADMVLRDDAFSSIVAAVEQGRIIFRNIRKSVIFMLCTNGAEILAVAIASFASMPLPLRPLQILYLNVLTDVFPALALGVGPGSPGVMRQPPRDPGEGVLTRSHWLAIGGWASVIGACVLAALLIALLQLGIEPLAAVTVSFLTLGFAKLWFVFNLREPGSGLIENDIVQNPWIWGSIALCTVLLLAAAYAPDLSEILQTRRLGLPGLGLALAMSLVPALLGQAIRLVQRRR